jgi:uncharacterized protein (DUF1015 family)
VPNLRPFRALRYNVPPSDLSAVLAPPYDIIAPAQRLGLLGQHPHNAVRIELPADLGSDDEGAYQVAAETVADWRRSGVLVKDTEPTVTVHQMRWMGTEREHLATGLLARLKLEDFGPGAGVLPHERTMSGPKQDRYRLLEATQMNTSPVVLLAGSDASATSAAVAVLIDREPDVETAGGDGVRHRLWVCPAQKASAVLELMASAPLTIADGHHRYETALAYRNARGAEISAAAEDAVDDDPAWGYLLVLIYPLDQSPPALPTHRVIRGRPCGEELLEQLRAYAGIEPLAGRAALLQRMQEPPRFAPAATGTGRIGILTRDEAAILMLDRAATDALLAPGLSAASRGLDVNALTAIIDRTYGDDPETMAADGRLWYAKDAQAATQQVEDEQASACFLLDEMPATAISEVAAAGEVMPHKSTYFNPKAPTGILFSPLEW